MKKYFYYDRILLNVLDTGKMKGEELFTRLFEKNKSSEILAFLDNESSLLQDFRIISSLPLKPFLKAALEQF